MAGATTTDVFTDDAAMRLAALSGGVPRAVNVGADAALTLACGLGRRQVDAELLERAWAECRRHAGATDGSGRREEPQPPHVVLPPRRRRHRALHRAVVRITPRHDAVRRFARVVVAGAVLVGAGVATWRLAGPGGTPPGVPASTPANAAAARTTTAVAAAGPPAPEPAPPAQPVPTASAAMQVVDEFRRAWELRDADQLRQLLTADAVANGRRGPDAIAGWYADAFRDATDLEWQQPTAKVELAAGGLVVRTRFVAEWRAAGGAWQRIAGVARWRVVDRDGQLRIAALDQEPQPGDPGARPARVAARRPDALTP